jgi:UDP-2-acetamido-2-deoxy-ribo-hexuluronate aminotransferase
MAGTIGDIGCTSFFPSKNLGCYGDGGALFTRNAVLAEKIKMIANHGQEKKYVHKYIGVNSRLDSIQAAILNVKLDHLDTYAGARLKAADYYSESLAKLSGIEVPYREANSTHVFHQYTMLVKDGKRDVLKKHLEENGVPAMIYYPIPLDEQEAFRSIGRVSGGLEVTKQLCVEVLSIPIHTEMTTMQQDFILKNIHDFFKI